MIRPIRLLAIASATALVVAACGTSGTPSDGPFGCGTFGAYVDGFPTPVQASTSPFPSIDDAFLEVAFAGGFQFPFYGTNYGSVFLNTNGGMTFGAGDDNYDVASDDVTVPAIAAFWGDMDAGQDHPDRADQMRWRQSDACFQVAYRDFADNDDSTWDNTATVTLRDDGAIRIDYGTIESTDIMVGVFDGTHTDDRTPGVQAEYDLSANGTGILLYDYHASGGTAYDGALNGDTIDFVP